MSADSPMAPLGRRLLQRAASPGVIRHDVITRLQRRTSVGGGLAAEIQRRWLPAAPGTWGYGSDLPYFGFGPGAAISHQGFQTPGYPERIVPEGTTPPSRPLQGSVSQRSQGFQSLAAAAAKADLPVVQRRSAGSATEPVVQRQAAVPSPTTGIAAGAEAPSGTEAKHAGALRPVRDGHFRSPGFEPGVRSGPISRISPIGRISRISPIIDQIADTAGADARSSDAWATGAPPLVQQRRLAVGEVGAASVQPVVEMGPAIVHRAAGRGRVQRRSLTPAAGAGDAGTRSIQHRRTAGSPVQRMVVSPASAAALPFPLARAAAPGSVPAFSAGLSATMAGLAMPLARPEAPVGRGGSTSGSLVIQRRESDPAIHPPSEALHGMAMDAARSADAEKLDLDEVVERVMRRLTRSLTVESERHGGCR